jgi:hypothetical protein
MHHRGDEWLTPPRILEALGEFDLDPCAAACRPWPTARCHYIRDENGLAQPWKGRVWLNPPFSQFEPWLQKMADHGNGVALLPASTETGWFQRFVWPFASALLFLRGRPHFYDHGGNRAKGSCGWASVLVAYDNVHPRGLRNWCALANSGLPGAYVGQPSIQGGEVVW